MPEMDLTSPHMDLTSPHTDRWCHLESMRHSLRRVYKGGAVANELDSELLDALAVHLRYVYDYNDDVADAGDAGLESAARTSARFLEWTRSEDVRAAFHMMAESLVQLRLFGQHSVVLDILDGVLSTALAIAHAEACPHPVCL